jgi:hypothetical protein
MACARKQSMWYALVIICAFLYLFANGQQTRIMTASVSAIKFQELNFWIHTCDDPGCLSGCHRRADARKLHAKGVIQVSLRVGVQLIHTYKKT